MTTSELPLPSPVLRALDTLGGAGYEAWVVGGAVRDILAGRAAQDWDVTTSAAPEEILRLFPGVPVIETGRRFGTVTVVPDGLPIEITTYRVDGAYSDGRRPDTVRFTGSLDEDLARRDFTVNAIAYHPTRGLRDPFGGQGDIRAGLVRCVGAPELRFEEDALRILRALRFASQFGMKIEGRTAAALRAGRARLGGVAPERVRSELTKLLCGAAAADVLRAYADVVAVPLPELASTFGFDQRNPHHDRDVWEHTLAVVDAVAPQAALRWAALLHDVGKPDCFTVDASGVGHFYGHWERSVELTQGILKRLRFSAAQAERITALVRLHDAPVTPERKTLLRLLRRLGEEGSRQLIDLHRADTAGHAPMCQSRLADYASAERLLDELLAEQACFSLKDLAVNGRDALSLGLSGPAVGRALEDCLDAVMRGEIPNERTALLDHLRRCAGHN